MQITLNNPYPNSTITIKIGLENGDERTLTVPNDSLESLKIAEVVNIDMLEVSKADREAALDFSDCPGFDEYFMGFHTPMPSLERQLKRQVAPLLVDPSAYVLKYYNYSTIQHAIRKMPIVSAINVDGDPESRKDKSKRQSDDWLRDHRIDPELQLTDAFYKKSNFDKGHMSRREDANWGDTEAEALRNAIYTCMYTNACPQTPELNQAVFGYHGLWGELEKTILEKGVKHEDGKTTRICVYNGPIFVATDPVFRGIQIPLRFFKIVVWLNGKGQKKATAFILSQEDLVGGIQFEELQFEETFKEHQCSIEYLENLTGLQFNGIRAWDTFVNDTPEGKRVKRVRKDTLEALVADNAG